MLILILRLKAVAADCILHGAARFSRSHKQEQNQQQQQLLAHNNILPQHFSSAPLSNLSLANVNLNTHAIQEVAPVAKSI